MPLPIVCDTQYRVCMDEGFEGHQQELRRGTIVLACLRLLRTAGYGYGLLPCVSGLGESTGS